MEKTIGLISANYINEGMDGPTEDRALATIPFGGRYRLIDFPLSNMMNSGISSVGIVMPFNNRSLIDHVGTGKAWGFGRKTHSLFMLQGSVYGKRNNDTKFLLKDIIANIRYITYENTDFVLMSGCSKVYSMDYRPLIKQHAESGCKITRVYKGSQFLDCFVINTSFLLDIISWFENLDFMGINFLIDNFIKDTHIGTYEFKGYYHNIDSIQDYYEANMDLLNPEVEQSVFNSAGHICTNVQDRCPTYYGPNARIKNSLIAAGCIIDGTVENSIIFRSSSVAKGAVVKNSILMQHTDVEPDAKIKYFVCDKRVRVSKNAKVSGTKKTPCFIKKGQTI